MTKLYVGNLPYSYTETNLREMFAAFGNILSANVISDRSSGRSKGFGFVELEDDSAAQTAIAELNGTEIEGRKIVVNEARPMEQRPRRQY
ncbi:MAG: RNA-binding protein [candidate division WWE3 bacterium GW2011_GWA1_41_8]|uniref:RNA-binding protein n=3 Tax=Katanobacteria TaxID=422282 RepID=A0A0G0XBW1_UNCKA|nr:MAG: RNA-binding protein [candidate division WWE3 bacterium GW2011_GWA1_41_8]OGC56748.1 MAG: RNA-binding protein [candidate division WWE3 bacterium RIFCSPLOWO2_01_FULL_41_9]